MTRISRVEAFLFFLVCGGIGAVAYADSHVETISLAYLYILPLALSAMTFRTRVTLPLLFLCVAQHDMFSPVPGVRFRGSEAFADDLTLIVLKVKGDDG